jgi:hypothetical protein
MSPIQSSPIEVLRTYLFPTLRTVCPERAIELFGVIDQRQIRFEFNETEERILFQSDSTKGVIRVGTRCLERLWALAYCYFIFYDKMREAKLRDPSVRSIGFGSDPTLAAVSRLLSWAISVDWQIKAEGKSRIDPLPEWPDDLPRPIPNPAKCSNEDVADKLFLTALGFILHHELAHIRLDHVRQTGTDSVLQEKDADRSAAAWLLDNIPPDDNRFVQRLLGIALAMLWIAALDIYVPPDAASTHPPGYDRLYQLLAQHLDDPHHPVWGFVSLALEAHLHAKGCAYDTERPAEPAQNAVNYYIDVISKLNR